MTLSNPRTLDEMLRAGRIIVLDEDITEKNFPVKADRYTTVGVEAVCYAPVAYGEGVDYDGALVDLFLNGQRPATIEKLLAYAEANPKACNIVAQGSSWMRRDGVWFIPYLGEFDPGYGSGRFLDLVCRDFSFPLGRVWRKGEEWFKPIPPRPALVQFLASRE